MTAKNWLPPAVGFHSSATTASVTAWIEDFRLAMLEIGLTQTADTGQFNASTFTYAYNANIYNTSTELTYLIFAFSDSLQTTAPIYIRVGIRAAFGYAQTAYGYTVASTVTVGSATNGAGTITANAVTISTTVGPPGSTSSPWTSAYAYQSYASFSTVKSFVGVVFNGGRTNNAYNVCLAPIAFFVERIPDASGTPTNQGYTLWANPSFFNSTAAYSDSASFANVSTLGSITQIFGATNRGVQSHSIPYFPAVELVTPDLFCCHAYHSTPDPVRSNGLVALRQATISRGTEFEIPVYGTTNSRFLALDNTCALRPCAATSSAYLAFLFE